MSNLELNYNDYIDNAIFSVKVDKDDEKQLKKLTDKINEYNSIINNDEPTVNINIGYSPEFGYYTYSKVDENNYQLLKLGKNMEEAFLKIVIYDIEFSKAVRAEDINKEKCVDRFQKDFGEMDYSSCLFYAEYILGKLKKYYKDDIPLNVIKYFENYLSKTMGSQWEYRGDAFFPVKNAKKKIKKMFKELDKKEN